MNKYLTAISLSLLTLASSSQAFADCEEMGGDEWNKLSMQMATAYDQNNLDEALMNAKKLTLICNRSPIVNYTMSEIYRKMDNERESYNYVKKATDYILDYPVPQALTERIWMRRAEFDLPYKKQLEDLQNQLNSGTGEVGSRLKQTEEQLAQTYDQMVFLENQNRELLNQQIKTLHTVKWIGAGTAFGGLALAAVGAGLLGANYSKASDKYGKNWNDFDKKDAMVHGGIAMLAGGIGLGLAGSAVAIYSYLKSIPLEANTSDEVQEEGEEVVAEPETTAVNVNFDISPNSVVFGLTF